MGKDLGVEAIDNHWKEPAQPDFGLEELADKLEARGLEEGADQLRDIGHELEKNRRPPGLFSRMRSAVREKAGQQWRHVIDELRESKQVWQLIKGRVRERKSLTPEEVTLVRGQILDIIRVLPASGLAIANAALPVPGTGLFTPWLLMKLGLMPSRWREAHTLRALEKELEQLTSLGALDEVRELEAIMDRIVEDTARREQLEAQCALLTIWDANGNGVWDEDEFQAYSEAVLDMRKKRTRFYHHKHWYLQLHYQVFGPVFLSEIEAREPDLPLLVSYNGRSGWVTIEDLLSDEQPQGLERPKSTVPRVGE